MIAVFFKLVLVLLLILLNAYFVASEYALVTIRKTKVDELVRRGNTSAKFVRNALDQLTTFISATQLGVTVASIALGWIGEPTLANIIHQLATGLPEPTASFIANTLAVTIAFILITFLEIILGELVPKSIALQQTEQTAQLIILPLTVFAKIFSPIIWLLNVTGNALLRVIGLSPITERQSLHSEEEIKMLLRQSGQSGLIPQKEIDIVHNVFQLGDIAVKSVMIPRTDILAFSTATTLNEVVEKIAHHPHSRFPVYKESIDQIIGFIHIKDIYQEVFENGGKRKISQTNMIRDIIIVPEIKKIDSVLQEMRRKRIHMAIVNDEFGGTEGVVTLEDIIESLVGEIEDEFDEPEKEIEKLSDGSYAIDGSTQLPTIQTKFHLPIKGQGYTTIGGLVFGLLGREPRVGDSVQIGKSVFKVKALDGKRIKTLHLQEAD